MNNPPLKCECADANRVVENSGRHCITCGLPIHPTTEPKCCELCLDKRKINFGACLDLSCPCHTPPVEGEWVKRFDEKYGSFELCDVITYGDSERLKSFITTLLHTEREKGRDSGENRILAVLRHHKIDYSEAIRTRREWDKLAEENSSLRDKLSTHSVPPTAQKRLKD